MKTIAIIGTGIAGMAAGYFLKDKFDITFYEKNDYAGGHTNTVMVKEDGVPVFIDTGFIVYNEVTYPNLTRLFKELNVQTSPTSMSFSVQHVPSGLEYCGTGLDGLFAQRFNLVNPSHWAMLLQMSRFCKESAEVLEGDKFQHHTVSDYVKEKKLGQDFLIKFLIPISSAVWSSPPDKILHFPIVALVRFFKNHGMLGLKGHYQWRTVTGGSKEYRDRLMSAFTGKVLLSNGATEVVREFNKVTVYDASGARKTYDMAILACHADEAAGILGNPTPTERWILKNFPYQPNRVTLHTDSSVMPKNRRAWASWNNRIQFDKDHLQKTTTIYDMNSLQKVSKRKNYFISINDPGNIDPKTVLWERTYDHPLFDLDAIRTQAELPKLNESGPIYFCGAYFRYGFHEDALDSGLEVARKIAGEKIWA